MRLERFDPGRVDVINPLSTVPDVVNQTRILENAQMLRNGGARQRKTSCQPCNRQGALGNAPQYRKTRGLADGMQSGLKVSVHLRLV